MIGHDWDGEYIVSISSDDPPLDSYLKPNGKEFFITSYTSNRLYLYFYEEADSYESEFRPSVMICYTMEILREHPLIPESTRTLTEEEINHLLMIDSL